MQALLIKFIQLYRLVLSPWIGGHCRFTPTCSHYMQDAIIAYGAGRGLALGLRRLGRCHPWCAGGYDPVPPREYRHG